jgi:hypothetical protein
MGKKYGKKIRKQNTGNKLRVKCTGRKYGNKLRKKVGHFVLLLLSKKHGRKKYGEKKYGEKSMGKTSTGKILRPNRACSGHVTLSLPVKRAPLGRILRNSRLRMRRTYFRTWLLPVTSCQTCARHHFRLLPLIAPLKCDSNCAHILLT